LQDVTLEDIAYLLADIREILAIQVGLEISDDRFSRHAREVSGITEDYVILPDELDEDYTDDVIRADRITGEMSPPSNGKSPEIRHKSPYPADQDYSNPAEDYKGITQDYVIPTYIRSNSSSRRRESNKQHNDDNDSRARVAAIAADLPKANEAQAKKDYLFSPCPYEREIGEDTIREIAQKLAKIDQGMGGVGWVKKLFREAYHVIGRDVSRETLVTSIQSLFRALEKQKDSIRSFTSWAMAAYPGMLSDLLET
jgi:hypothetical protein